MVLEPVLIESFGSNNYIFDISCGREFSVCVAAITTKSGDEKTTVYAWGDGSRGQLGSGDLIDRMKPQENRWLTKLLKSSKLTISSIKAGGWHVLALTNYSGQVISWGAGDYGQLGHGFIWDDSQPKIVNAVKYCEAISAGARHSCAIMNTRQYHINPISLTHSPTHSPTRSPTYSFTHRWCVRPHVLGI